MADFTYTEQSDYEREIEIEISGTYPALPVLISEVEIAVETWTESGNAKDYETRWISAKVEILDGKRGKVIHTVIAKPENLNVGRNFGDAGISDLLDEIAEEAFLRDYQAGEFGEIA